MRPCARTERSASFCSSNIPFREERKVGSESAVPDQPERAYARLMCHLDFLRPFGPFSGKTDSRRIVHPRQLDPTTLLRFHFSRLSRGPRKTVKRLFTPYGLPTHQGESEQCQFSRKLL